MDEIEALREDPSIPRRSERIAVDEPDFQRIRANLGRGVDAWVSVVVVDDDGRVLLVQNRWSDGWLPPGGSVEPGEALQPAAAREVREETGVAATIGKPVAVVEETFTCEGRSLGGPRVSFAARAETTALDDDPGLDGEGIEEVGWFGELPERVEQRWLLERGRERGP